MSRTAEDWLENKAAALRVRSLVREALDILMCWPSHSSEFLDDTEDIEVALNKVMPAINALIGATTIDWVEEEAGRIAPKPQIGLELVERLRQEQALLKTQRDFLVDVIARWSKLTVDGTRPIEVEDILKMYDREDPWNE